MQSDSRTPHTTGAPRHDDVPEEIESQPGVLDTDAVAVRTLVAADLDAMARLDRKIVGRSRREYLTRRLENALHDSRLCISLAAEIDGTLAGFLMGSLYYGEFGIPEPVAILDTLGVDPDLQHRRVGSALLRQLVLNLRALGIESIRTEVEWTQRDLLAFFAQNGFQPAARICLELRLGA